jgi:hypothetical protein
VNFRERDLRSVEVVLSCRAADSTGGLRSAAVCPTRLRREAGKGLGLEDCLMRALGSAVAAAWSGIEVSNLIRWLGIASTVVATTTAVLLASFVAVAISLP